MGVECSCTFIAPTHSPPFRRGEDGKEVGEGIGCRLGDMYYDDEEENDLLTQTGPGTPCGEMMRRYWQPVALTEELPAEARR